jgi:menaquinone-dependent protoporphyrinogen IX oxidase
MYERCEMPHQADDAEAIRVDAVAESDYRKIAIASPLRVNHHEPTG